MVLATALVGQAMLGWHNDLVDRVRDAAHERAGQAARAGDLDPATVWFWLAVAVMLVVPLAVSHGVWAGLAYLGYLLVGILGNVLLRGGLALVGALGGVVRAAARVPRLRRLRRRRAARPRPRSP